MVSWELHPEDIRALAGHSCRELHRSWCPPEQ